MRGHEKIIDIRKAGKKPPFVFVNDYPCEVDWFQNGESATVCTHGDSLVSMDFRFLNGLRVSISATTEERAKALFELAKASGAEAVAAGHVETWPKSGWAEAWERGNG